MEDLQRITFDGVDYAKYAIANYLSFSNAYSGKPFGEMWKLVTLAARSQNYLCVGTGNKIRGLSGWINLDPNYVKTVDAESSIDLRYEVTSRDAPAFILFIHADDRKTLLFLTSAMKKHLSGGAILWNRHKGNIKRRRPQG